MTISAKIVCDSISEAGVRITTMQLRYPRFIHAEFMTHRMFSRNASSSRAIPVEKLIKDVIDDTAMPIHWGKNQKGMQADDENDALVLIGANASEEDRYGPYVDPKSAWFYARDRAIEVAQNFSHAGYHKQIVNRLLEPFSHINVVVTATDWANFFALRDHKDAQPEIRKLARQMKAAMKASEPMLLRKGEWHLPYIGRSRDDDGKIVYFDTDTFQIFALNEAIEVSTACCASTSYKTVDGLPMTIERAVDIYDKLLASQPIHASPAEHQARPDYMCANADEWVAPELHGNFTGWIQFRKTLPHENITDLSLELSA